MVVRVVTGALLIWSCISSLSLAQDASHMNLNLASSQGIVQGRVVTIANNPISDVQIELESLQEGRIVEAFSDSNGRFSIGVPQGSYVIRAASGTQLVTLDLRVNPGVNPVELTMSQQSNTNASRSVVSAQEIRVPEKARKALQKAEEAAAKHQYDDAYRNIDKALQVCPTYAQAFAMRGVLERDSHPDQALVDTETAIKHDPHYGMGYVALGSVLTALGRFDDAVRSLEHAIAMLPASWQGYFEMSRALIGKRNYTAALDQIERASRLTSKDYPFVHLAKADIFFGLHQNDAAAKELEAYLREEPNGPKSLQARQVLDKLHQPDN